jgi:hypothetical protein
VKDLAINWIRVINKQSEGLIRLSTDKRTSLFLIRISDEVKKRFYKIETSWQTDLFEWLFTVGSLYRQALKLRLRPRLHLRLPLRPHSEEEGKQLLSP